MPTMALLLSVPFMPHSAYTNHDIDVILIVNKIPIHYLYAVQISALYI